MTDAPWPVVEEYHRHTDGAACSQCDGSHEHEWIAWHAAPEVAPGIVVVGGMSGPGLPVRCRICGGRKCDVPACMSRRHHEDAHTLLTGGAYPVGGYEVAP